LLGSYIIYAKNKLKFRKIQYWRPGDLYNNEFYTNIRKYDKSRPMHFIEFCNWPTKNHLEINELDNNYSVKYVLRIRSIFTNKYCIFRICLNELCESWQIFIILSRPTGYKWQIIVIILSTRNMSKLRTHRWVSSDNCFSTDIDRANSWFC